MRRTDNKEIRIFEAYTKMKVVYLHKRALLMVLYFFALPSVHANSCVYPNRHTGDFETEKDCLTYGKNSSVLKIKIAILKQARFDENHLSFFFDKQRVFYFDKRGFYRETVAFDNGPDYFEEGLARTIENNKIGYMNKKLQVVIPAQFDFGFPFNKDAASVCFGCKTIPKGEHSFVAGGSWFAVNKSGHISPLPPK